MIFEMILWVIDWVVFAASTGIVWEFLVNASLRADRVFARAVVVFVALALLIVIVFLADLLGAVAQHGWGNYPMPLAGYILAVMATVFLVAATTYISLMVWLLKRAWPHILLWFKDIRWDSTVHAVGPWDWTVWAVLIAFNALLLWVVYYLWRGDPFYSYRHALDTLGLRKFVTGMCLMAYLRLLVPRRDFFQQAHLVSWMWVLAGATLAHVLIPIPVFAVTTPVLILILAFPMWSGLLAPPLWIFLGTSQFDSFRLFYDLRANWRRHGVTLLDRIGTEGRQFYSAWRSGIGPSAVLYNPGAGRIWSLRTRPALWQTSVRLLGAFVPVIVVDWRQPSHIVQFEVKWIKKRGFLGKVYLVVSPEHSGPAEHSITGANLVDEGTLLASQWTDMGLRTI